MPCGGRSAKTGKEGLVPVFLNVYDLTSMNSYAYWLGLGVYHSGVQVHGVEYAFGSHEHATTGISGGEPRQGNGFAFRKQILIGFTEKKWMEVRGVMEELAEDYKGNSYNLIARNCNHFCNDACVRLTGNAIPSWINRLAKIGSLCSCIIPASVNSIKVGIKANKVHHEGEFSKNHRSRSGNGRYAASSSNSSLSSEKSSLPLYPVVDRSRSHRSKASLPPSSPMILNFCFSSPASP
ncbi:deSI-like protein At4g17486 [Lactuca sativa]|uniref:PPPDE domain-containing protein n=1 Tax=Lactuca sativa TaxID=4236 RepID=A0A9R1XA10_LACSA|nr:deSI-like protein At4g17486 [Lactuca sativa]KAJ0204579.1 hypothetical protein LSAT_V11C500232370 [Lactuca sativa]